MGEHAVAAESKEQELRAFTRALLEDVHALERMLAGGLIESGVRRVGAEQEMFLVDRAYRPAPVAVEVLEALDHPQFTTELGRFNLEANLLPRLYGGDCLRTMEAEATALVQTAREAADSCGALVALVGILPTLHLGHLTLDFMTPKPRYFALNRTLLELRGGAFHTVIKGLDELNVTHDNLMLESCNTSFQVHFQVGPNEFAKLYNVAQAVTAPVVAAAANSGVLLQQRLWHETRIALFQQSVDARSIAHQARGQPTRVHFGEGWVRDSVIELFQEDIARFRVLLASNVEDSPSAVLDRGEIPSLGALCLHNGTVYRWNRPCYGVNDGVAHLRIENRVMPSGPTVTDEVANAAFYFGLMSGMLEEYGPVDKVMAFDDAKNNFLAAARRGLEAQFHWMGETVTAGSLVLDRLVPLARQGLRHSRIDEADIDHYIGVIEERVRRQQTGAQWMFKSLVAMGREGSREERHRALTAALITRQSEGKPVHEWSLAGLAESGLWQESYRTIGQFMTTDLYTVHPGDVVELAANVMEWRRIRYLPVEDERGLLVGLVTEGRLLRLLNRIVHQGKREPVSVGEIMNRETLTATPETPTLEAIQLMRERRIGCLPVVRDGQLVGIVTERDFMRVAGTLMEKELAGA